MFIEARLDENISYGATGGVTFNTDVTTGRTKIESRNELWVYGRYVFKISYDTCRKNIPAIRAMFHAARGRARGFRFKDFEDFTIENQVLGVGDGVATTFQLIKNYDIAGSPVGAETYERKIVKPVAGTLGDVLVNSVITPGVTMDSTTGIITLPAAPSLGEEVEVSLVEFDIPMRFDRDTEDLVRNSLEGRSYKGFTLLELNPDEFI